MSSVSAFKADVRSLQSILNSFGADLSVDGIFGSKSALAVSNLVPQDRRLVKSLADRLSVDLPEIISWDQVNSLVVQASRKHNVPKLYLQRALMIENVTSPRGILIDNLGKHRGLGQFDEPTWKSVTKLPWSKVSDPASGVNALAQLYNMNRKNFNMQFKSDNYTLETAYLYHNQGASSAAKFLKSGSLVHPAQSAEALETMRLARKQYVNNGNQRRYFV
jgi:hypothetical protein